MTLPIYGKLADLYGRKPMMLVGIVLFLGGSFLCGHAGSMNTLILFRAIQGLGAGAIQPIAMTIVGDLFDVHQRARIQGVLGAVWGLAGLTGPVLGGAIVHWLSWRWVFYVNIPLGLACAAVLVLAYHEKVERHDHRLDFAGAALLSITVVLALLATRSRAEGLGFLPAAVVALALFLGAFWAGQTAESIAQSFPTLSLEQVYGAITFYLGHREETERYLADYPNMFGDLSAGSGLNALTRDETFTPGFFQRHQDKLMYGSDCNDHEGVGPKCQGAETIAVVRRFAPNHQIERKLLFGNAKRLFSL